MRVCFVVGQGTNLAGSELSLLNIIDELSRDGRIEPSAVLQQECMLGAELASRGVPTLVLKSMDSFGGSKIIPDLKNTLINHAAVFRARRFLLENRVDIVHANNSYAPIAVPLAARNLDIPYLWHFREYGKSFEFVNEREIFSLFRGAAARIAVSEGVRAYWEDRVKAPFVKVLNGVPTDEHFLNRSELFGDGRLNLLLVGRVKESKGQMDAVRAVEGLLQEGEDRVRLTIVGLLDGPYDQQLRSYVLSHGLNDNVELCPYTDDLLPYRRKANVGLMCSASEAFGRVTVEYMMSGMLVVGTRAGGTVEIIKPGETGFLYDPGNWRELAAVLKGILGDFCTAECVAHRGQEMAMRDFSIKRTANEIFGLYRRACLGGQE